MRYGLLLAALAGLSATVAPVQAQAQAPASGASAPSSQPLNLSPVQPMPPAGQESSAVVMPIIPPPGLGGVELFPVRSGATGPAKGSIAALDPQSRDMVQKINTAFNALTIASGEFVQVAPDGSRTQGHFYLQKPGKVRFDYAPPSPIEFISDGGAIAVRDRKLATQDITPLSQTPLRFLLAEKIDLLRDAPLIAVQRDELFVSVILEERHAVAGTHRLTLMFGAQDFQLKQWTVTDPQGYDTTVAIYNIDTSRRPSPELFRINYERVLQ